MCVWTCSAQDLGATGVYTGTFRCDDQDLSYKLELINHPDDSVSATFYEFPSRTKMKDPVRVLEMKGAFQRRLSIELELSRVVSGGPAPRWMDEMSIHFVGGIRVFFRKRSGSGCHELTLMPDAKLSSKFISEERKRRQKQDKAIAANPALADLSSFEGFWIGRSGREHFRLIAEKKDLWLQDLRTNDLFSLKAEKSENGILTFGLSYSTSRSPEFSKMMLAYKRAGDLSPSEHIEMHLLGTNGRLSSRMELERPKEIAGSTARLSGRDAFIYKDWQDKSHDGYYLVNETQSNARLKQTIDKLYENNGWGCLAQQTVLVRPGAERVVRFEENGINRRYLIYSPFGNASLIYDPVPAKTFGYLDAKTYDYPVFETSHRDLFIKSTVIAFSVKPSFAVPLNSSQEIPVTIFIFGRTPGDYGTGCEYIASKEVADKQFRTQLITKIGLAFLLEAGRRVSNDTKADIPQLLSTYGRNELIKSAITDLFPKKSASDIDYIVRWVTLAMGGDFRPQNYLRDSVRESIVQKISKDNPNLATEALVTDLLVDLYLQRKGW